MMGAGTETVQTEESGRQEGQITEGFKWKQGMEEDAIAIVQRGENVLEYGGGSGNGER